MENTLVRDFEADELEVNNGRRLDRSGARDHVLAGNATLTFKNTETGGRFTYKVRRADGDDGNRPWFVSALVGTEYLYFANIWPDRRQPSIDGLLYARKAKLNDRHPAVMAFIWLWQRIDDLPGQIEIWHSGMCLRCGRKLTVPESIDMGYGPECASKIGAG